MTTIVLATEPGVSDLGFEALKSTVRGRNHHTSVPTISPINVVQATTVRSVRSVGPYSNPRKSTISAHSRTQLTLPATRADRNTYLRNIGAIPTSLLDIASILCKAYGRAIENKGPRKSAYEGGAV